MKSKKKNFTIRLAKTKKDLEGILHVQVETWVDAYTNLERGITESMIREHYKQRHTEAYIKTRYDALKEKEKRTWIVLDSNSNIVGWIWCMKEDNKKGSLAIYILPDFQGYGIGTVLMNKVLKWLHTQKYIEIGVVDYNKKALKFYEKFGFTLTGKKEDFKVGDFVGKGWVLEMRRENTL